MPDRRDPRSVPVRSREETRSEVLSRGRPLPPPGALIIEGLTDEEEAAFVAAVDGA